MIKSKSMTWLGHVACMGEEYMWSLGRNTLKEGDQYEDLDVDGRIILLDLTEIGRGHAVA
jgi:hypothetical protein